MRGAVGSTCFHAVMQGWFEWLCSCDQDPFLYAEGELCSCLTIATIPLVALPYNICSAFLALGRQGKLWGHTQRIGDGQGWAAEQDGGILFQWRRGAQPVRFWITKRRVSSCEPELEQPQAKLNSLWNRSEQWLCFTG